MNVTSVKVKTVKKLPKKEDVYNMEVAQYHNFPINGGYIVHNCIDSVRYSVEPEYKRRGK